MTTISEEGDAADGETTKLVDVGSEIDPQNESIKVKQTAPLDIALKQEIPSLTSELLEKAKSGRLRWITNRRDFRARAHSNPLNDGAFFPPISPDQFDTTQLYGRPNVQIQWCDIGCGYGGLLAALAAVYPEKTMLGLEIRDRVAEYCTARVSELRSEYPGEYTHLAFLRTNAMKFLPNYFRRGQLEKIFFCYPDPHFKRRKNRQRIVSTPLLAEYAYILRPGGVAYIVTDVPELYEWMVTRFEAHPLFQRRSSADHAADTVSAFVRDMTDEAQRVEKSDRGKQCASFIRLPNPERADAV